jgi:nucleotidyltransferase-like protein
MPATLPPTVRTNVDEHLSRLDAAVPGLVASLYVVGSVALGDYHEGVSDIDFVGLTSRSPDDDELDALEEIHHALTGPPHYDGVYAAEETGPDYAGPVPFVVNGAFHRGETCRELSPVLWLTLSRYGIAARGPEPGQLGIAVDPDALRAWNAGNLIDYWRPLAAQLRNALEGVPEETIVDSAGVVWVALGPSRLHHTLLTGDITSKTGAAAHIARHFPQWTELAARAAQSRSGSAVVFTAADAAAAADLTDAVIAACRPR